jgi:uncharacterized phiE125 gp8 family phage protein
MTLHALRPVRTAAPASPVVTLAQAKAHLRVEFDDDDVLIQALVDTATAHLDGWAGVMGRALVTQTWRVSFPGFPDGPLLRFPLDPVQSIVLTYVTEAGATATLSSSLWRLVTDAKGPCVVLDAAAAWPQTADRPDAVTLEAVCGYGAPADVPGPVKAALLLMVGDLYANREAQTGQTLVANPVVNGLLAPLRRVGP